MRIKSVQATCLHVPIPEKQQHVSDFGKVSSFDCTLVRIETECGIVGWGEAKEEVGSAGNNRTVTKAINEKYGPDLVGEDPRDIVRLNELMYNGVRGHYALAHGRVFPALGRRGASICAMSGIDLALWDILGKSLNAPVWRLLGGRKAERMPIYASGGWADAKGIGEQLLGYVKKGNVSAVKMRVGIIDGTVAKSVERVKTTRTAIGPVLTKAAERINSRGIVVLISDLFVETADLAKGLARLRHDGHDVLVVQVLDDDEVNFPFEGQVQFHGLELDEKILLNPRQIKAAYLAELDKHITAIDAACRKAGADHILATTSSPVDVVLSAYFNKRAALSSAGARGAIGR